MAFAIVVLLLAYVWVCTLLVVLMRGYSDLIVWLLALIPVAVVLAAEADAVTPVAKDTWWAAISLGLSAAAVVWATAESSSPTHPLPAWPAYLTGSIGFLMSAVSIGATENDLLTGVGAVAIATTLALAAALGAAEHQRRHTVDETPEPE